MSENIRNFLIDIAAPPLMDMVWTIQIHRNQTELQKNGPSICEKKNLEHIHQRNNC